MASPQLKTIPTGFGNTYAGLEKKKNYATSGSGSCNQYELWCNIPHIYHIAIRQKKEHKIGLTVVTKDLLKYSEPLVN